MRYSFKDMSPTASYQSVWQTLRRSIYDHKNEQPPNFHIITPQIPTCKTPKLFLVWRSIQCYRASKKVANVKTGT